MPSVKLSLLLNTLVTKDNAQREGELLIVASDAFLAEIRLASNVNVLAILISVPSLHRKLL